MFVLAIALSAVFALVVPAFGGYDEAQHFQRAWQVSDGGVFARVRTVDGVKGAGGDVPGELVDDMSAILRDGVLRPHDAQHAYDHLGDRAPGGERVYVTFNGAAVYSPVPYLPAAVAIRAGRLVGASTFVLVLLARFAQLLAYAALVALAVRRIPRRKLVLAAFALAPVALVEAGTINADAMTIALALLVVAEAFHLAAQTTIRAPQLVEALAALGALGLAKQPYLLVAAFFVLPMWRHRGRIAALLGAELAVAAGLAIAWNQWAQSHYVPPNGTIYAGDKRRSFAYVDVDPAQQFTYVREHPFSFIAAVGRTIGHAPGTLVRDMFTQTASWHAGVILVVLTIAVLLFAILVDAEPVAGGRLARTLAPVTAVVLAFAVFLGGYAGWNAVGAPRIDEFQGRYLLPILAILVIVGLPAVRTRLASSTFVPFVFGASALVTLAIAAGITRHFYF